MPLRRAARRAQDKLGDCGLAVTKTRLLLMGR
jgi:hypothetical protein